MSESTLDLSDEGGPEVLTPGSDEDEAYGLESQDDDEDGDDEGEVVDVGGSGLVKRERVVLADGSTEWVKSAAHERLGKEERRQVQDLYRAFVREATRFDRLSEDQERALGLKVRDHGDKNAAKKLVVHNLRLAIKMAHQYRRTWANIMDLVQEASAGMAIAAERWDPDQGTRFGTYAVYWIRAQLTKFLMTNGRMIHTGNTRAGRKLYFQLPRIRRQLVAAGQEPTIDAIAKEVGEDPEEVARVVARLDGREASLSAPLGGDDDGGTLGDLIEAEVGDPEETAAQLEMSSLIGGLIERYQATITDERDRAIWTEHLISQDPTSLVELGKRYGVSKQRMGQLATKLKRGFRRHVIDELGPETQLSWLFNQD